MLTGDDRSRSRTLTAEDRSRPRSPGGHQIGNPPEKMAREASPSVLTSSAETVREQMERLIERLERTLEPDVNGAVTIPAAQRVKRISHRPLRAGSASADQLGEQDIANLLEEAIEEDAPDRKLAQISLTLGLLLASLDSPSRK